MKRSRKVHKLNGVLNENMNQIAKLNNSYITEEEWKQVKKKTKGKTLKNTEIQIK